MYDMACFGIRLSNICHICHPENSGSHKERTIDLKFYCEDINQVLEQTSSTREGLTTAEAEKRLAANGKNKLAEGKKESLLKKFMKELSDPMIIILIVAAAVSGVLAVYEGEGFADVIIILAVVIINAVLGVYQESKAEKAIEALQDRFRTQRRSRCG